MDIWEELLRLAQYEASRLGVGYQCYAEAE